MNTFLEKDDSRLPDSWGMKIIYWDKSEDPYQSVGHLYHEGMLTIVTADDKWVDIAVDKIKKIEFDKDYSTYKAVEKERRIQEQEALRKAQRPA